MGADVQERGAHGLLWGWEHCFFKDNVWIEIVI